MNIKNNKWVLVLLLGFIFIMIRHSTGKSGSAEEPFGFSDAMLERYDKLSASMMDRCTKEWGIASLSDAVTLYDKAVIRGDADKVKSFIADSSKKTMSEKDTLSSVLPKSIYTVYAHPMASWGSSERKISAELIKYVKPNISNTISSTDFYTEIWVYEEGSWQLYATSQWMHVRPGFPLSAIEH